MKAVRVVESVEVPDNVKVSIIDGCRVRVEGPKGVLERDFCAQMMRIRRAQLYFDQNSNRVVIEAFFADRKDKALIGTIAGHVKNMIIGVTKGWRCRVKLITTHFPATAKVQGNEVLIEGFLGERAPRRAKIVGKVKVTVQGKDIIVEGIDIEEVMQTAANIEQATKVKDKDRRVFVDGAYIYEKGVAE